MANYTEITTANIPPFDYNDSYMILYIGLKNNNTIISNNVTYPNLNTLSNSWCECQFTKHTDGICKVTIHVTENMTEDLRSCLLTLHCNDGTTNDITKNIKITQVGYKSNQFWVKSSVNPINSMHVLIQSIGSSQAEINKLNGPYNGQVLMQSWSDGNPDLFYGYLVFNDNNTIYACNYSAEEKVEVPIGDTVWIYFLAGSAVSWREVIVCRNTPSTAINIDNN